MGNQTFSKHMEKVIARCIENNMQNVDLHDSYQTTYETVYWTKTTLLKNQSNTVETPDKGSMAALILLDLSAALDAVNHSILLKSLEFCFGIKEDYTLDVVTSF